MQLFKREFTDEMKDIMKIVKPLEESGALPEGYSETVEYEAKRWIYSYPIRYLSC